MSSIDIKTFLPNFMSTGSVIQKLFNFVKVL
jgi:hypothetical protein